MPQQDQSELGIYAIWDLKGLRFDTPFFAINDLFAKRRFMLMIDESPSVLQKWKEDFELHKMGNIRVDNGRVDQDSKIIMTGKEYKNKEDSNNA